MDASESRAAQAVEKSDAHKVLIAKAKDLKDKGYSNVLIADVLGTSESNVRVLLMNNADALPVGTKVEFDSGGEGSLQNFGVILNHVPLEDGSVAYHIACYYVMPADMVKQTSETEYAEPWKAPNE